MSGLPVDIFDPAGGFLYELFGARPNWATGADSKTAMRNVPRGYYFNHSAFVPAIVEPGQPIPSANEPAAIVDRSAEAAADIGDVGRNILRGPGQSNLDISLAKRVLLAESKGFEFRADSFNVLNHPSRDNPISDIRTDDFGKIVSFSSSPRIVQLVLKFNFRVRGRTCNTEMGVALASAVWISRPPNSSERSKDKIIAAAFRRKTKSFSA